MATSGTAALRASRPSIEIDGRRQDTLTASLMSLFIAEHAEGLAACELGFGNWGGAAGAGFQHFGRDTLDFGKTVRVQAGDASLFEGRISAMSASFPEGGPPLMGVSAEDRLQDLRMTRRTRSFSNARLGDVLRSMAAEHGLQPRLELQGEPHRLLAQANQSDLAFLRDLARREDAQVWVEGTQLRAAQRASTRHPPLELSWAGTLREFDVVADLAHQRTALVGAGWNVADKRAAVFRADESAIRPELGNGASGAQTLQRAFGARADTLAHGAPGTDAQARALAQASFRHMARRFVTGRGVAETHAGLRVGARLDIRGVGPLFEGDYTVTTVHIRFDAEHGLRTEFWCDRAFIGSA